MLYLHGSIAMSKPSVKHTVSKLENECYRLPTLLPYLTTGLLIMYHFILQSSAKTPSVNTIKRVDRYTFR